MPKIWEKGWPVEEEEYIPEEPELNTPQIDNSQYFIPPKDQIEMFRRLRQMDCDSKAYRDLKNDLIMANLKLVYKVANDCVRLSSALLQMDELLSYGVEGLYAAIDRFDPDRGTQFSTLAYQYIRKHLQIAVAECGFSFTTSPERAQEIRKYHAIVEELTYMNSGVAPTPEEIAKRGKWSLKKVMELSQTNLYALSMDEKWAQNSDGDDDERTLGNVISDPNSYFMDSIESDDMVQWVCGFVRQRFNETAQEIFFQKMEDPEKSYAAISREIGVNPETVRVIYNKIVEYLRYVLEHGKEPKSKEDKK